ncbi:DUF2236 domain-containing protein, partial [Mycobacterium sp. ITM-2017-0098]
IGERLMHRDEVGAALVAAMKPDDPAEPVRVTMGQFKQALERGVDSVPDCPAPLRDFFSVVDAVPSWVDFDLVNRGAAAYRRLGTNASD